MEAIQNANQSVLEVVLQQPEIGRSILLAGEHFAAIHTSLGDMAGNLRQDTAVSAWHTHDCTEKIAQFRLSPFPETAALTDQIANLWMLRVFMRFPCYKDCD